MRAKNLMSQSTGTWRYWVMASEWEQHRLSDVLRLISGGTPRRSEPTYWGGDVPWLSVKDFSGDARYVSDAGERISQVGLENSSTKLLHPGQIIVSARGTVGELAQIARPMALNQSCYGLDGKPEYVTNDFLYYLLRHTVRDIRQITHGAVFDTITRETFEHIVVLLPPMPLQQRIAHILGSLDDKIELNRRMNRTLEKMAAAIFKSWCIDFDPVHAKAEGRDPGLPAEVSGLFPSSFEDSALGPMPKGWTPGKLADVADNPRRTIQPSDVPPTTPYIGLQHMPRRCIALDAWGRADEVGSGKSQFKEGEILFGKLRPYFHKVGIVPVDGVCSTDILVVVPKSPEWHSYALSLVSSKAFVDYTDSHSAGTKMPRTNWKDMGRYPLALPPEPVAKAYQDHVAALHQRIGLAVRQNRRLAG